MRQTLVVGNWKMNGTLAGVRELLAGVLDGATTLSGVELAVLPPFVYLPEAAARLAGSPVLWGGQNLSEHAAGAYTGEVAGSMLRDYDCRYVLVGHSERRSLYGETSSRVADKFVAARTAGLIPILCVGESLDEREKGMTESVVAEQLDAVLERVGIDDLAQSVIAYEPVWAIGTGKTATPEQAQEVHAFIRGRLAVHDATIADSMRILYGGSVKAANAAQLFRQPDIDGGLIGGASLDAKEFLAIARAGEPDN
jgi:triosephosphate isomerase